jgi:hypothetical protein
MRPVSGLVGVAVCLLVLTGCVDRRFIVTSNPPGAAVYVNQQYVGATPVDYPFVYYGDYEIILVKDGYQTKRIVQNVPAPWYEYYPIDFVSEVLWPQRLVDVQRLPTYDLEPAQTVRTDVLLDEATRLRTRGQALVTPEPGSTRQPAMPPPAPVVPVAGFEPAAVPPGPDPLPPEPDPPSPPSPN